MKITSITVDKGILSWCWIEEAYQVETYDKFATLVESIRGSVDSPNFFKQITITFNPWSERHWLKPTFFDKDTRLNNTFSYTTTYRVNEWLDESILHVMRTCTGQTLDVQELYVMVNGE